MNKCLENEFQKIHSDLDKVLPTGMIYHYTNFSSLEGILTEKKLRCSDFKYFNDPTELQYGKNLILNALSNTNIDKKLINRTRELFDDLSNQYHLYIACFSQEIKKLALWRYYAFGGTGCAIGFNEKFHKRKKSLKPFGKAVITKVNYGNEKCLAIITRFIECYLHKQSNDFNDFSELITHLIALLPSFKDESFREEEEVRIFYMEGSLLQNKSNKPFYFNDKFRLFIPIQNSSLPFINKVTGNRQFLTPDKFRKTDIDEIWIGPSCEFLEARKYICSVLINNGYNIDCIKICQSRLPFRAI